MQPEQQERQYVLRIFRGPAPVHCAVVHRGVTLSSSPQSAKQRKERKKRTQKGRSSSSTALGRVPTTPLAASRSPALTVRRRPLTLPNFHAFFLEVPGAPLSVANSRPTATPSESYHGLLIRPLTYLVVLICCLPGIDRSCEPCWLAVVVRRMLSADYCRGVLEWDETHIVCGVELLVVVRSKRPGVVVRSPGRTHNQAG